MGISAKDLDSLLGEMEPEIKVLENERLDLLAKRTKNLIWSLAILAGTGLLAFVLFRTRGPIGLVAVAVGAIGLFVSHKTIVGDAARSFQASFKRDIVRVVAQRLQPDMEYQPGLGIDREAFVASELFSTKPDRYSTEDQLAGRIGETEVILAEVHAEDRRTRSSRGKTETYYVDIFRGILFIADFHKDFRGVTRVLPDNESGLFSGLGKALKVILPFESEEAVRMADPEFEQYFRVYSTDHVEAHYLLPPSMLRRISDLRVAWGNHPIRLSFVDSKVSVAIPFRGNLLNANPKRSLRDGAEARRIAQELDSCLSLVNDLELNTRIWSKE